MTWGYCCYPCINPDVKMGDSLGSGTYWVAEKLEQGAKGEVTVTQLSITHIALAFMNLWLWPLVQYQSTHQEVHRDRLAVQLAVLSFTEETFIQQPLYKSLTRVWKHSLQLFFCMNRKRGSLTSHSPLHESLILIPKKYNTLYCWCCIDCHVSQSFLEKKE